MTDCGCVGMHDGKSHDQHMDELWRARNRELLEHGQDEALPPMRRWLALAGFAKEEQARLSWKLSWMERPGSRRTS